MKCALPAPAAIPLLALTAFLMTLTMPAPGAAQDAASLSALEAPKGSVWLDSLDLDKLSAGRHGKPGQAVRGTPMTLDTQVYPHGVGVQSGSEFRIDLKGQATRFVAMVGIDAARKTSTFASASFEVYLDGKKAGDSGVLKAGDPGKLLSVD